MLQRQGFNESAMVMPTSSVTSFSTVVGGSKVPWRLAPSGRFQLEVLEGYTRQPGIAA